MSKSQYSSGFSIQHQYHQTINSTLKARKSIFIRKKSMHFSETYYFYRQKSNHPLLLLRIKQTHFYLKSFGFSFTELFIMQQK